MADIIYIYIYIYISYIIYGLFRAIFVSVINELQLFQESLIGESQNGKRILLESKQCAEINGDRKKDLLRL